MELTSTDRKFEQALVRLTLLGDGATAQLGGLPGDPNVGDRVLSLRRADADEDPTTWRRRYAAASREADRKDILFELESHITSIRFSSRRNDPQRGSIDWKKRVANDERTPTEVAHVFGVSRTTVYEYRKTYRRAAA